MTEILTESFCERCGTRYTFESARPRMRLKGVKVLSRGLKNFVLSDDTSMDEAMASARSETDRESTSFQLDAFHKTFNFCMSCRQYTCPNCWNEGEMRCLTCAPHLGHEILQAPFPDLPAAGLVVATQVGLNGSNGSNGPEHGPGQMETGSESAAWTDELLPAAEAPIEAAVAEPEVAQAVAEAPIEAAVAEPEVVQAVAEPEVVQAVAEPEVAQAVAEPEVAQAVAEAPIEAETEVVQQNPSISDKTAAQTAGLLQRFRPGQNLDAELDAYEHDHAAALAAADVATPSEAPLVVAEVEGAPEAGAQPDVPVVEPEIAAAAPGAEPPATEAPPVVDDVVSQPTWRMVAPDPGAEGSAVKPVDTPAAIPPAVIAANPDAAPQWPTRPSVVPSTGLPFLGRQAAPQGGLDALWAQSNREVVANPLSAGKPAGGVQPCVSCGLSLSATARFCRRCGTLQAS